MDNVDNNNEVVEIVDLAPTLQKIKDAFSTSSESFSRRFKESLQTGNLASSQSQFRENNDVSSAFEQYAEQIQEVISKSKDGLSIDDRNKTTDELEESRLVLKELSRNEESNLSMEEFENLNDTIKTLIKEVNPRTLSRRIIDGSSSTLKEFTSGVTGELRSGVNSLTSFGVDLAEEFPPLQFAIEKGSDILTGLVGKAFTSLSSSISKRKTAKEDAKELSKSFNKDTKDNDSSLTKVEKDNKTDAKMDDVDLSKDTLKRIKKIVENESDDGLSNTQSALLGAGALSAINSNGKGKDKKEKKGGFLGKLGLIALVPMLIGFVVPMIAALGSALLAAVPALLTVGMVGLAAYAGTKIGKKIHEWFPDLRMSLTNALEYSVDKFNSIKDTIVSAFNTLVDKVSMLIENVVNLAKGIKGTIDNTIESGKDFIDDVKAAPGKALESVRETSKSAVTKVRNLIGLEPEPETIEKVVTPTLKKVPINPNAINNLNTANANFLSGLTPTLSNNKEQELSELNNTVNLLANALGPFGAGLKQETAISEKTMINNNNVSNTHFINKVSPDNFDSSFNFKNSEGFPK